MKNQILKKKKSKDIELEVLSTGEIRFRRNGKIVNDALVDILSGITDEKEIKKIKEFFDEMKDIEVILGDQLLCG